jgi:hypothetical protein
MTRPDEYQGILRLRNTSTRIIQPRLLSRTSVCEGISTAKIRSSWIFHHAVSLLSLALLPALARTRSEGLPVGWMTGIYQLWTWRRMGERKVNDCEGGWRLRRHAYGWLGGWFNQSRMAFSLFHLLPSLLLFRFHIHILLPQRPSFRLTFTELLGIEIDS